MISTFHSNGLALRDFITACSSELCSELWSFRSNGLALRHIISACSSELCSTISSFRSNSHALRDFTSACQSELCTTISSFRSNSLAVRDFISACSSELCSTISSFHSLTNGLALQFHSFKRLLTRFHLRSSKLWSTTAVYVQAIFALRDFIPACLSELCSTISSLCPIFAPQDCIPESELLCSSILLLNDKISACWSQLCYTMFCRNIRWTFIYETFLLRLQYRRRDLKYHPFVPFYLLAEMCSISKSVSGLGSKKPPFRRNCKGGNKIHFMCGTQWLCGLTND